MQQIDGIPDTGTYGPNFFGYSVTHSAVESRRVLSKLKGKYSEKQSTWQAASANDKSLLLLEDHESAHHQLFSGTPCGLLLWRLNEVIARDITWACMKAGEYGVGPPQYSIPRDYFTDPDLEDTLVISGCDPVEAQYISDAYRNIENCLVLRDIFFGSKSPCNADFQTISMQELCDQLNQAFEWMSLRCAIPWTRQWTVKGDGSSPVSDPKRPINSHHIAEAHAVAHELNVIRAYDDKKGLADRYKATFGTSYEPGILAGQAGLPKADGIGFSPFLLRHRAILAFCTKIDLSVVQGSDADLYVEDHLPWTQYQKMDIFSAENQIAATEVISRLISTPVYGTESKWSSLSDMREGLDSEGSADNMLWLGMDLQVYAYHRNAETLFEYLTSYLKTEDFAYDKVTNRAIDSNYLVEYDDELLAGVSDLEEIYGQHWELLASLGFDKLNNIGMQTICHLLKGSTIRNTISRYLREQIPSPEIIAPKLAEALRRYYNQTDVDESSLEQLTESAASLVKMLVENGQFGEKGEAGFLVNNHGRFVL